MKISELMVREVEICHPEDDLAFAASKMWDKDIGCLAVLNEKDEIISMITDRDICMAAYMQGRPLFELPVSLAMSKELFHVTEDMTLTEAEKIMRTNKVRRLPVLNNERKVVGIVSLSDVIQEAEREIGHEKKEVSTREVVDVLADVCKPRTTEVPLH